MRFIKHIVFTFTVLALVVVVVGAGNATQPINDPAAVAACKKLDGKEKTARAAYDKAMLVARAEQIKELTVALDRLTKAGKLDDATRVRDLILVARQANDDPTATPGNNLLKLLPGTKWEKQVSNKWDLTFYADGSVTTTHHGERGTWAVVGDGVIRVSCSMESCKSELLKISPDGKSLISESGKINFVLQR